MRYESHATLVLLTFLTVLVSGASSGCSAGPAHAPEGDGGPALASVTGTVVAAPGVFASRALVQEQTTPEALPVAGVHCTLEGTDHGASTDAQGSFAIPDVADGSYVLICTKQASDGTRYTRLQLVEVDDGQSVALGRIEITPVGRLRGVAQLSGQASHAGIQVAVLGTSYAATTEASGAYLISDVAGGALRVQLSHQGYRSVTLDVALAAGATLELQDVLLGVATGPWGEMQLNGGALWSATRTVPLRVTPSADARLFMLSEDPDFVGLAWQPVESLQSSWEFQGDGEQRLYARFADANGLVSAPNVARVIVDTTTPTVRSLFVAPGDAASSYTVSVAVDAYDLGSGVAAVELSNDAAFSHPALFAATVMPLTMSWEVPAGAGAKTIYARALDGLGHVSAVATASIECSASGCAASGCANVDCPEGQYCLDGECQSLCQSECGTTRECGLDACGIDCGSCAVGTCNNGICDDGCDDAPAAPAVASLDEVRASILSLVTGWRFAIDPSNTGVGAGWASESFADGTWATLNAGTTWEAQGYPSYDGAAWYRKHIVVPTAWSGSPVRLFASGVDDEYDVYVNGVFVKHHGERGATPETNRSVWGWQTITRIDSYLRFGADNLIAIRVNDWGGGGGLWRDISVRRAVPLAPYREFLPTPVVDDHPEWVELYWQAWRMAFEKISFGTAANGFSAAYMDEGFNEQIYQWDSSFIAMFARYGTRLFPAMPTLDNFYSHERADGYIQRVYSETTGGEVETPTADEPVVNPPLFAWIEWQYFQTTGDASRLPVVFPKLEKYFAWLKANVRGALGQGLYYQTGLGSGMDNTPRGDIGGAAWVDMSLQQALAAKYLERIATQLGQSAKAESWRNEHEQLRALINAKLWNDADGFYYDLTRAGTHAGTKHAGAFWALIAEVAGDKAPRLVAHLTNPAEFYRPHLFPTLAASHPSYSGNGHYWQGGVWAPTNYMIIKGLERSGFGDLAREAAVNHLTNLAMVYANPPTDTTRVSPEERDGEYQTLWECYAPEQASPATRWDDTYYSRQDFVGWTGLGPIALLIETVLGFDVRATTNTIRWTMTRTDRHGIENLQLGSDNLVSLVAAPAPVTDASGRTVTVTASTTFTLVIARPGKPEITLTPCGGTHVYTLD